MLYKKLEWPDWQELEELDGFENNSHFSPEGNIFFVREGWLATVEGKPKPCRIETRFKIGDKVFFMHNNKIDFDDIKSIDIRVTDRGNEITYKMNSCKYSCSDMYVPLELPENRVYASKQELINSL